MQNLKLLLKISRYRFWIYTAGPYLLGYLLATPTMNNSIFFSPQFLLSFFYFLIPANIFIYGINDYFDEDTDKHNPKKGVKEHKLKVTDKTFLKTSLVISSIFSLLFLFSLPSPLSKVPFIIFIFLSFFYSAPPLRFKSKPFLDSTSNVLYIIPGIVAYSQFTGYLPPLIPIIGFWFWASAMHLFSAIPDIVSDKKAGINTTAVLLGKQKSLILCAILWALFSSVTFLLFNNWILLTTLIYPAIPIYLLFKKKLNLSKIYWYFPYINTLIGFIAFLLIVESKMYGN